MIVSSNTFNEETQPSNVALESLPPPAQDCTCPSADRMLHEQSEHSRLVFLTHSTRIAPHFLQQVQVMFQGSFMRMAHENNTCKGHQAQRNNNEVRALTRALALLLDQFPSLASSDGVESMVRRIVALQQASLDGNWKAAWEIEDMPPHVVSFLPAQEFLRASKAANLKKRRNGKAKEKNDDASLSEE